MTAGFEQAVLPDFQARYGQYKQDKSIKVADLLASSIQAAMVSGKLKEGDRLPREGEMIELLGVSRGAIREALKLLESRHLIEIRRGAAGGAVVSHSSGEAIIDATLLSLRMEKTSIGDFFQANCMIVPRAARLAAQLRPREAGKVLKDHARVQWQLKREGRGVDLAVANGEFSLLILQHCGNKTLEVIGVAMRKILNQQIGELHNKFLASVSAEAYETFIIGALEANTRLAELVLEGRASEADSFWDQYMQQSGAFFFANVSPESMLT